MVASLTGGSMLLMWLGELVTEQSLGNGISLIITVGIISRLPSNIHNIISSVVTGKHHWKVFGHSIAFNKEALIYTAIMIVSIVILTWLVVMFKTDNQET